MINFQDEVQNLAKFTHFEKNIFIRQWLTQNMWFSGATMCILNKKLQKISLKNSFIWKNEKTKKDSQSFCKVIPLATFYVLATIWHMGQKNWWHGLIFSMCSWMNDIYGWKCGWKMKMDEFFHKHWQQKKLQKLNKKNRMEIIYVGLFWNFGYMKCWSHISSHTSY